MLINDRNIPETNLASFGTLFQVQGNPEPLKFDGDDGKSVSLLTHKMYLHEQGQEFPTSVKKHLKEELPAGFYIPHAELGESKGKDFVRLHYIPVNEKTLENIKKYKADVNNPPVIPLSKVKG